MADTTSLAESSQALFCALADYALLNGGPKRVKEIFDVKFLGNYEVFSKFWNNLYKTNNIKSIFDSHIDTGNISFNNVEKFLNDNNEWYISSILTAKKLITDIDKVVTGFKGIKRPKVSQIWFVRGDKAVMDNISELFKVANKTQQSLNEITGAKKGQVFSNLNKWSPADIYFSSDKARKVIQDNLTKTSGIDSKSYSFDDLNIMISDLIETGELLPLSLKKQTKEVNLYKVNFDRKHELEEAQKIGYHGTNNFKKYTTKSPQARYLSIYIDGTNKKNTLTARHDPSTNVFKCEFVVTNSEARGGGASSPDVWYSLLAMVDPAFATKFLSEFKKSLKEFKEKLAALGSKPPAGGKEKEAWNAVREEYSALIVSNKLIPMLIDFLEKDKEKSTKFVRLFYLYVTSRAEESSKFVISK